MMSSKKSILFVCVENSNRSQMAEAFARMLGPSSTQAYSGGSRPSGRINPKAIEAMRELGYDLTTHHSKGLEGFNGTRVEVAVTMGCGDVCPFYPGKRYEDWVLDDPAGQGIESVRVIRDEIKGRVEKLLAELLA